MICNFKCWVVFVCVCLLFWFGFVAVVVDYYLAILFTLFVCLKKWQISILSIKKINAQKILLTIQPKEGKLKYVKHFYCKIRINKKQEILKLYQFLGEKIYSSKKKKENFLRIVDSDSVSNPVKLKLTKHMVDINCLYPAFIISHKISVFKMKYLIINP